MQQIRAVFAAMGQYVSSRIRLARLEGKEAGAHLGKVLGLLVALAVLAAFGWFFICVGVTSLLAGFFPRHGWLWASLLMGTFHFLLVGALAAKLKGMAATRLFPLTTEELKKDQEWLDQQNLKKQR